MTPQDVKYLVVHCAATRPGQDIGKEEIDIWHRKRGFNGCGYHFVIRRDGTIEEGRPLHRQGAHVEGQNHHSIGICLVGGVNDNGVAENNFTAIQMAMLRSLLNRLKVGAYRHAEVIGHRDFPNVEKDCPSFDVREWW